MYDFDNEYWDVWNAGVNASYNNWLQKSGSPTYVRMTVPEDSDSDKNRRASMVIVLHDGVYPITGSGVSHAYKSQADEQHPFDRSWVFPLKLQLFNEGYRTDANNIVAIVGETYGINFCTIPSYEDWSAMTTEEKDAFKATYFEPATPESTTKIGVSIGEYYDVYAWVGAIVRGGDYPSDQNYPYYKIWGDLTTTNGRVSLDYNAETQTPTYRDFEIIFAEPFSEEDEGVFKAIVIVTQMQYRMRYWTGYSNSGNMTYTSSTQGESPTRCDSVCYNIRCCDWKIDATTNNGYPYRMDMTDFSFDLVVDPIPSFFWRMNNNVNQGYPYLVEKDLPVLGAFGDNKNLRTVVVPRSVSYIGDYAFANTKLSAVTISEDCEYNENTSFPPRCVINHYT